MKPLYQKTHISYFTNLLKSAGCYVEESFYTMDVGACAFVVSINGKIILIDFSDFQDVHPLVNQYDICLKYHKSIDISYPSNVFSFSPISFYNWIAYEKLQSNIRYQANNMILNMQRAYGNAVERRKYVKKILIDSKFYPNIFTDILLQNDFWKAINNCLVGVFVPGARNDILDRGQFEYMAFGCCTISPKLTDCIAFEKKLEPDIHYVQCKDDYSDLIDKIQYVYDNKLKAMEIGTNVKKLFSETSMPSKLVDWIKECLNK